MGIDKGFDVEPPLEEKDQEQFSKFINEVIERFSNDLFVRVFHDHIIFLKGENPIIPFDYKKFQRFESKISGGCYEIEFYIDKVSLIFQKYFPNNIKRLLS